MSTALSVALFTAAPGSRAEPPSSASAEAPAVEPAAEEQRESLAPYAIVTGLVGAAGFGLFAVAGVMDRSTYQDLQQECPTRCPGRSDEIDTGRRQQIVANVGLVVGIVGAAATAALIVLEVSRSKSARHSSLVVGPASAALRGRF